MRRDEDQDGPIYTLVFAVTIALFLFVGYQVYKRYFRSEAGTRPEVLRPAPKAAEGHPDDPSYDRAPSSIPALKVDDAVQTGR